MTGGCVSGITIPNGLEVVVVLEVIGVIETGLEVWGEGLEVWGEVVFGIVVVVVVVVVVVELPVVVLLEDELSPFLDLTK